MIAEHFIPEVLIESSTLNELQSRMHGLDHWWRVWKNGQMLARDMPDVDLEVVALFALFHDSMRLNDYDDPEHGTRGWLLWKYLDDGSGTLLTKTQDLQLVTACEDHHHGHMHSDPTVGVCWDANRLDQHRLGIWPDPRYMSTGVGRLLVLRRINRKV